jgi:hypothetical protein
MATLSSATPCSNDIDGSRGGASPPRLLSSLVAIAGGLLAAGALHGAPPPPGPFAAGEGQAYAYAFEFGAVHSRLTGDVSGRATFSWSRRPRGSVEVRVTCLSIHENAAVVGGQIVRRTGRRVPKRFRGVVFFAEDKQGEGRADRISRLQLRRTTPSSCGRPGTAALGPIRSGDIAVDSGNP